MKKSKVSGTSGVVFELFSTPGDVALSGHWRRHCMGGKGLTVNLAKTKVMISDINRDPTINSGKTQVESVVRMKVFIV